MLESKRDAMINLNVSKQLEEQEQRTRHSVELQRALELDGSPVAVAIVSEPPEGLECLPRKTTACVMIQTARRGASFCSSAKGILCGGRANLGMGRSPIPKLDYILARKEKLFRSEATARKFIDALEKRAPRQGEHLAFSPLEKASFVPDVVLLVGTPSQISRIMFLSAYETGEIDTVHGEPLCSGTIATPIATGKIGISFLDMACRLIGRYRPEEMVVGIPYPIMLRIVDSIHLSSAGTAKLSLFLRLAARMLRRGVPRPQLSNRNQWLAITR